MGKMNQLAAEVFLLKKKCARLEKENTLLNTPKRPVGRPAGSTKPNARHRKCTILLNDKEFGNLTARAATAGMTVSAYLRYVARI